MDRKTFTNRTTAALKLGAALSLTAALAACGPDDTAVGNGEQFSLLNSGSAVQWPGNTFGMLNGGFPGEGALPPLPEALPMQMPAGFSGPSASRPSYVSTGGDYGYAPEYYDEYYPEAQDYYDPREPIYYDDGADSSSYAFLALAALLGGVLADSPPDYGFHYGGVQPWVWETGDRYVRYAEPIQSGYRYYYYEPNAVRPFLVRDPYYSYGYRQDRLVAIYDRDGRVIDRNRMIRQRRIAERYYDRGYDLYRAGNAQPRYGVAAPLWARQRAQIVRSQNDWDRARDRRSAWRSWDQRYQPVTDARWSQEQVVRRYAGQRFAKWQKTDYRGDAPRFYREAVRNETVRRDIRVRQTVVMRERQEIQRRVETERRNRGIEANDVRARQIAASQQRAVQMRDRQSQARQFSVADQQRIVNRQADMRRQQFAARDQREVRRTQVSQQADARRQQTEVRRTQVAQRAVERRQQEQARSTRQQQEVRRTQVAQRAVERRQQEQARSTRQQQEVRRTQVAQQAEARRQQSQSQAQARMSARRQQETRRSQVTQQAEARRQQSQMQAQARAASQRRQVQRQAQRQAESRQAQAQSRQAEMRQQRASQMQAQRAASAAEQRQARQVQRQSMQAQRQQAQQAQRQSMQAQRQSAQTQQRQMQAQQRSAQMQQARMERSSSPARQPGRQGYGRSER